MADFSALRAAVRTAEDTLSQALYQNTATSNRRRFSPTRAAKPANARGAP